MNVSSIDIAVGADRIAIFSEIRDIISLRQRAAFVDLNGNYMAGIGIVPLGTLAQTNVQAYDDRVTWTGEMFVGVLSTSEWNGTGYTYRWWLWRFLPDGTNVEPGGRMIAQSVNDHDAILDVHWAGKDLWIFARRQPRRFTMSRVVCSCGDADGDLFNACSALDCDDGDPLTHPGALEACRGLRDEDCDGLVDCDDPDCPAGAP